MKKILTVSIMAVMAVTAANAEIASKAYVDQQIGEIDGANVAAAIAAAVAPKANSTDVYTQSAADAKFQTITNLTQTLSSESTTAQYPSAKAVYDATKDLATTGNVYSKTDADAKFAEKATTYTKTEVDEAVNAKADSATTLAGYGITDAYTKEAADAKFDTIAHVGTIPAGSSATTVIGYVDEKAAAATNGMLTTSNYATTLDPVYINANEVTSTYAADGTAPVTGAAVNAAITSLNLANTYQAKGDYATAAQGALADTALQQGDVAQTYSATGTAPVSGTAVASAISTAGANYATSAQGLKADSALQPTAVSGTTGTKLVEYNAETGLVTGGQAAGALATKNTVATADIDANAVTLAKLTALSSDCQQSGVECVLKSSGGNIAWEVIARSNNGQ